MTFRTLLLGCAMAAGLTTAAQAQLVNGSFETGDFTGWSTSAFAVTTTAATAYDGTPYAATDGDDFAQLNAGAGEGVYSTVSQAFTLLTAMSVSGDAAFLGFDYLPYDDDAYVRIFQTMGQVQPASDGNVFYASIGTAGTYGDTGWTRFVANLGPGSYTIEAGVANRGDNVASSVLLLDNVSVAAVGGVPEPAAWALMILGFGGVGSTMRARRRALA